MKGSHDSGFGGVENEQHRGLEVRGGASNISVDYADRSMDGITTHG